MSFRVDVTQLGDYGEDFQLMGADVAAIGPYCKQYAGQTDGMTGLLDVVSKGTTELANVFGDHYTALSKIVTGTGSGLITASNTYAEKDAAARAAFDKLSKVVGAQTDAPFAPNSAAFGWSVPPLVPTKPDPDPSKSARDGLDIDVKAINWIWHKVSGDNITQPIDDLVGNWTTLTAQGEAWQNVGDALKSFGKDITANTKVVDTVWNGNAARTFDEYGNRLGGSFAGEAEICYAIKLVLDQLATQFENIFNQVLDLLQSIIHQCESAAAWLAALWWCGVGEAALAEKLDDALQDFLRARRLVKAVELLCKTVQGAINAFQKLKDLWKIVSTVPAEISGGIAKVKKIVTDVGAVPGVLDDLSKLPYEPDAAYGGPRAAGIS